MELAEGVGLTPAPCLRRVKPLEDNGVIVGYTALLDPVSSGAPQKRGDDVAGALSASRCQALESLGILVLNSNDDRESGSWVAVMDLDVAWVDRSQVGVEVAGLRIWVCPGILGHA